MNDPVIVIPARWASTRFPGKALCDLGGSPLIEHVWKAARATGFPVYVATDDARIFRAVDSFGGTPLMTGPCNNGTERCAEAARVLGLDGLVINWQGDSPLLTPHIVQVLAEEMSLVDTPVGTLVQPCDRRQADDLRMSYIRGDPGGTCAVLKENFDALYFSKAPVPSTGPIWLHLGVYAYRTWALSLYGVEEGPMERLERLEQLRFLEKGFNVRCFPVSCDPIYEVNRPADVQTVAALMEKNGEIARS